MTQQATHNQAVPTLPVQDLRAVLISGPLGSGKTTLLNYILQAQPKDHPGSFIVIENDIGSQNIDQKRLAVSSEDTLALTAGCICCNDLHALRGALSQLTTQRDLRTIFIETTGIANPATVKDLLHEFQIPALTIVTVDVKHFDRNEALGRNKETIPHADIIALTWRETTTGEIDRESVTRVQQAISRINPGARCVEIHCDGTPADAQDSLLNHPLSKLSLPSRPESLVPGPNIVSLGKEHSPNKHRMFTLTFPVRPDATLENIQLAVKQVAPDGITRAKGSIGDLEFDCTQGDWRFATVKQACSPGQVTLIHSQPLNRNQFDSIRLPDGEFSIDLGRKEILILATKLVEDFINSIPQEVIQNNRLITETVAGEAWRYVALPGFPPELKERFLQELLCFYKRGFEALASGKFQQHAALPYYQREVGYNLSWFLIDCKEELASWNQLAAISELMPVTLYFRGLESARDARHIGSFRETDLPYLRARLTILRDEQIKYPTTTTQIADATLAQRAIDNCCRLSLDGSWKLAAKELSSSQNL